MLCHCTARPIAPGSTGAREDHPAVIARPPRIAYLFLGIGLVLGWLWPLPLLPAAFPPAVRYGIGAGLAAFGVVIMTLALRIFRKAGTNVETWKPTTALATDGIYAWSRNPIYISLPLLFAAVAVLADSGWLGLLLVVYVVVLRVGVIAREECYLERKFGDAYRAYRAHVRRWF
jgi:protein-S-isoprenylcysteine O-methyltransferase Ste14